MSHSASKWLEAAFDLSSFIYLVDVNYWSTKDFKAR